MQIFLCERLLIEETLDLKVIALISAFESTRKQRSKTDRDASLEYLNVPAPVRLVRIQVFRIPSIERSIAPLVSVLRAVGLEHSWSAYCIYC